MHMTAGHEGRRVRRKLYGWLKRRHSTFMKECQKGERNSQHGLIWVTDGISSKKIQRTEDIPSGWRRGRVVKPNNKTLQKKKLASERRIKRDTMYDWFDQESISILKEFDEHRSIDKILTSRGYFNRRGSSKLSSWLVNKGRVPLRRRNSR